MENEPLRIGIDIGGTFTDFVVFSPASGQLETFKLLSTPHDPAEGRGQRVEGEWRKMTDGQRETSNEK